MNNKEKAELTYIQIKRMKQAARKKALKDGLDKDKIIHEYNVTRSKNLRHPNEWRNRTC